MKEYGKESYRLLLLWFLAFLLLMITGGMLSERWTAWIHPLRCTLIFAMIGLIVLFVLIYWTGNIYWINGVSYQEAKQATPKQRTQYAQKHLKLFLLSGIVFIIYAVFAELLHLSTVMDVIVFAVLVIVSAFRTISVHL